MAETQSNLEKLNSLINPDDIECYVACDNKYGRNLYKEPAYKFAAALSEVGADMFNLKLEFHNLDLVFIDIDDKDESEDIIKKLDSDKLNYILIKTERDGHHHVLMKPNDEQVYGVKAKGYTKTIIASKFTRIGMNMKVSYGSVLPTPYNDRQILKLPDSLDKLPDYMFHKEE